MWIFKNKVLTEAPEGAIGFVYKITRTNISEDLESPMFYIGKKNFFKKTKSPNKDSDWKGYYGSSEWIKKDIERYGKENFEREILRICYSKSEMTYYEVLLQFTFNVLKVDKHSVMSKKYYNMNILGKFFKSKDFSNEERKRVYNHINTGAKDFEQIPVTNGSVQKNINTLVEDLNDWLIENSDWFIDSPTSDSVQNIFQVTDGETNLFLHKENIYSFLQENPHWYLGSAYRGILICVNNGKENLRIHESDLDHFLEKNKEYEIGLLYHLSNNLIHIFHNETQTSMHIYENDFEKYQNDGWQANKGNYKPISKQVDNQNNSKLAKVYNSYSGNIKYILKENVEDFCTANKDYQSDYVKPFNQVYAIDMNTGLKIVTSAEELKLNDMLTSVQTKKVKIKFKNRIVFTGYLKKYCMENPDIPMSLFNEALRSKDGKIVKLKGKYQWVTDLNITIKFL